MAIRNRKEIRGIRQRLPERKRPAAPRAGLAVLRSLDLAGLVDSTSVKCFALRNILFVPVQAGNPADKLEISMLGGAYTVRYDGTAFASPYTRIEENGTQDLQIVLRNGQSVWPEWLTETTAKDIDDNDYALEDGEWRKLPTALAVVSVLP